MFVRWLLAVFLFASLWAHAQSETAPQTIVHMLDYIGVDYGHAVENGKVKSEDEFKEMNEFATQVVEQLKALRVNPKQSALIDDAQRLAKLVSAKAQASEIADVSGKLLWAVIGAYKLSVTPKRTPDIARASTLYTQNCAACHGAQGRGDGPASRGMTPAPANFHDAQRMANRSAYGLYNTITLGVSGTPMTAFKQLSEDERWALAFYVANVGVPQEHRDRGKTLWQSGDAARDAFPDLVNVATLSSNEVAARYGEKAARVQDYLRAHPEAREKPKPASLAFARDTLHLALEAYRNGDPARAQQLAVTAYLEGYELVEPALDAVDRDVRVAIENDMLGLRNLMRSGAPIAEVEAHVARVSAALQRAEDKLSGSRLSPAGAAVSSLIIILREGLEAILVLAALIAFLVKAERRDALRYIHAGWIGALLLGLVTWYFASYAVSMSGASRETTEGVTALVSSALLLYVGYWLHDKSHAQAWHRFIKDKLVGALSGRTIWALASLSFLAVYREVFETVLFYEALWAQAGEGSHGVLIGFVLGAAALGVIAALVFRYGVRLPIGLFFGVSSAFLAVLAVVFAGQGTAALQKAGMIDAAPLGAIPQIPSLGIFPTVQTVAAQVLVLGIVLAVYAWSRRSARSPTLKAR